MSLSFAHYIIDSQFVISFCFLSYYNVDDDDYNDNNLKSFIIPLD